MKSMFLLLGSGLLVATLAVAQDAPSADPSPNSQSSKTYQSSSNIIRGCLSGSAGNYTVTDQNGTQYSIAGPDNQLAARVGHEIEITTHQDQSSESSSQGDQASAKSTNSVQVSDVRDVSSTCKTAGATGSPMNDDNSSPKGSSSNAEPPQAMAMLQEQSAPNAGMQEQKPGAATQPQTTPPVSSQTPATSASPTGSDSQAGDNTGTAGSEASASGSTSGSAVDSQGASTPANAAPNSATPSGMQQPQANSADDANKPLYERQATDIPWANHSSDSNGTANSPH
jgi:trimeric autotransporter adhesin